MTPQRQEKHWSIVEYLHTSVKNPNIHIQGEHSYYSAAWSGTFEESVVRYLYGDAYSLQSWEPLWPIDQLYIGDYVCIAAEAVILMGGNNTHRTDWFSLYPFVENIEASYKGKGDTHIGHGAWIGMRAMIMPGVAIGEGAIVASSAVVTKDVPPYALVAGNPAEVVRYRFDEKVVNELLKLNMYEWAPAKFEALKAFICANDMGALIKASQSYDQGIENQTGV